MYWFVQTSESSDRSTLKSLRQGGQCSKRMGIYHLVHRFYLFLQIKYSTAQGSIRPSRSCNQTVALGRCRTNPVPESHQPSNGALLGFLYHRNLNMLCCLTLPSSRSAYGFFFSIGRAFFFHNNSAKFQQIERAQMVWITEKHIQSPTVTTPYCAVYRRKYSQYIAR